MKENGFLCGFCFMFGLDYIMKNMVTSIHLTDPEAHWLMLLVPGWALEGTRTLMMPSTGQQEKQVLSRITLALHSDPEGIRQIPTKDKIIYLDAFSLCHCRF